MLDSKKVDKIFARIAHQADYEYFFDSISSPIWIEALLEKGCFRTPPPPVRLEGYIQFPMWAESRYLVRMAKEAKEDSLQEKIVNIALSFGKTENVRVHEDLADIALLVSPKYAEKLLPEIFSFLASPHQLLLPHKIGSLIKKFAEAGDGNSAFGLAESVFRIIPDKKMEGGKIDVRKPLDDYHYKKNLEKVVRSLSELDPARSFNLFLGLLKNALDLKYGEREPYSDHSYIWRPSIETSKYNRYEHGIKFHLVDAVRASSEILLKECPEKTAEVVSELEGGKWTALDRIALHIMRIFPDTIAELIKRKVLAISLIEELDYRYEYFLLAREHVGKLAALEKQELFEIILKGPDLEQWKNNAKALGGPIPTNEELQRMSKVWVRDRLAIFKDCFDAKTADIYQALLAEVGEPDEDWGLPVQHEAVWVGPTTPKTVDDLKAMSVEEIVAFLLRWKSPGGWRDATPEGLSRAITEAVSTDTAKYAEKLLLFKDVDPTYLRGIIRGVVEAKEPLSREYWEAVLDLCSWAVQQGIAIPGRAKYNFDQDSSWQPTRSEICRLLKVGFEKGSKELPFAFRVKAFGILLPLTDDPYPSIAEEGEVERAPFDLAINSTRGVAIEALVSYALWVKRNLSAESNGLKPGDIGLKNMPEARSVFENHLDIKIEPTLAIRSIYGAYLHNLHYLDSRWIKDKVPVIFPTKDDALFLHFDAAWTSFLLFGKFDASYYSLLEEQYAFYAQRIFNKNHHVWHGKEMIEEAFSDHLLIYHLNGLIPSDDEGILGRFLENSSSGVRSHVMSSVGHWVTSEVKMSKELHNRYVAFWESRLTKAKATKDSSKYEKELQNYGWWTGSKHLAPEWIISQILEILKLAGKIEPGHLVEEFMKSHYKVDIHKSLECVRLAFEGDREGWNVYSWMEPAADIISDALTSSDRKIIDEANAVRSLLIAKGYRQFRNLDDFKKFA